MSERLKEKIVLRPPFSKVIEEFEEQAKFPPGSDIAIGSCYQSLLQLMKEDATISLFLEKIYQTRDSLTPAHFVNLFFRSIQFIKLYEEQNTNYRFYHTPNEWQPVLLQLINSKNEARMKELLLTKDTLTTKYQRYAGPRAIIATFWPNGEVNIADFGCGANYGLRGIELDEPFEPIEDFTPNQYFSKALAMPIKIHEGLAIDKQNPEDPEVKAWSVACSYYPKELDQIDGVKEFEMRLKKSKKVMFLHADLLSPPTLEIIPQKHFHVVILSTILYQQPPEAQKAIITEAEKVTAKDGILIIQDFASKDPDYPKSLIFDEPWSFNFGYRTFIMRPNTEELLEVFQWLDGRCRTVRPAEDYWKILPRAI